MSVTIEWKHTVYLHATLFNFISHFKIAIYIFQLVGLLTPAEAVEKGIKTLREVNASFNTCTAKPGVQGYWKIPHR